jgi:hypothetical protein
MLQRDHYYHCSGYYGYHMLSLWLLFSSVLMMVILAIFILRLNSKWCWKSCCRQESPDAGYVFNNAGTRHVPTMMKQIVCWIIYRFVHILLYTHKCVMHVCMYIYMHVCMYIYLYACICAYVYIYIHMFTSEQVRCVWTKTSGWDEACAS